MATDNTKILAGISAGGASGGSLSFFAPADTPGPVAVTYTAEVQTITMTAAGGTWSASRVNSAGVTLTATGIIPAVTTANLATALSTAWGITVGVAGTAGSSYVLTYPAALGNVALATLGVSALTGGTATIAETTPGAGATEATAVVPAAFLDAGWCDQSGLVAKVNESTNEVKGYGTTVPLRIILTESKRDFEITFLETNPTSIAIYNRKPVGSIVPDLNGAFSQSIGQPSIQLYAGVFDVIDGTNHLRVYCPRLMVSGIKDRTVAAGKEISYGVTFTALPDANGKAAYEYYVVSALGS
jgi:hypothetical protein